MYLPRRKTVCLTIGAIAFFLLPFPPLFSEEPVPISAPAPSSSPSPSPAPAPVGPPSPLTWVDCIQLAIQHNPDLQGAREGVLNSDAVRRGAYSTLYPQIAISFGDTRTYRGPGATAPKNYSTSYLQQLSLTQTIFDGFATKGNIEQGKAQIGRAHV